MSLSPPSSPEPDFLFPNGFQDVAVENVIIENFRRETSGEFDRSLSLDSEESPSKKRKQRSKQKKESPRKRRRGNKSRDEFYETSEIITDSPKDCTSDAINVSEAPIHEESVNNQVDPVIDLDEVSSPSPPDASYFLSESIQLSEDEHVEEPVPAVEVNPEITVRVIWRAGAVHSFKIRKFQKVKEIFSHFANYEGVLERNILLTLRDKEVTQNDTPDSLKIGLSFIEGGIISDTEIEGRIPEQVVSTSDPNALELKVQQKGVKEKRSVFINRQDNMKVVVSKLAEDLNIAVSSIKLRFDGEILDLSETPDSLDLEGGECLDLIIKT